MNDLVSIITPSFNTAKFIGQTIMSVKAQTYTNWEMIIVDDRSTDDTDNVVEKYLDDARIHYIKNDRNSGAAISRNRALAEAKGRWIAFLDSDDLWEPTKLEKQISFMETRGYSFSYTKYQEMDEQGTPFGVIVGGPQKISKLGMYAYCWPGCLTVMYDADKIGLVQIQDIRKNNDYAIWLQVCKKADCYLLDECLAHYRKRSGSISNHNYSVLVKWHYRLWKEVENNNTIMSALWTGINLGCGLFKKLVFVKRRQDGKR